MYHKIPKLLCVILCISLISFQPLKAKTLVKDNVLYLYVGEDSHIRLDESITLIKENAFVGLSNVTIQIPKSVKNIEKRAFSFCNNIIIVFDGNPNLHKNSFYECQVTNFVSTQKHIITFAKEHDIPITRNNSPKLQFTSVTLERDYTKPIVLYNNSGKNTYTCSNSKCTVSPDGLIVAKKKGKCIITVNQKHKIKVTITDKVSKKIKKICKPIRNKSKRYKISFCRKYLQKNVTYDYRGAINETMSHHTHMAYGALIKKKAVCDGYANAFKRMMDYFNIPCKVIIGTKGGIAHAWNKVKYRGSWHKIDTT